MKLVSRFLSFARQGVGWGVGDGRMSGDIFSFWCFYYGNMCDLFPVLSDGHLLTRCSFPNITFTDLCRWLYSDSLKYFMIFYFYHRHQVWRWQTLASRFSRRSRPRKIFATLSSSLKMRNSSTWNQQVWTWHFDYTHTIWRFLSLKKKSYRHPRIHLRGIFGSSQDHRNWWRKGVSLRSLWFRVHPSVPGNSGSKLTLLNKGKRVAKRVACYRVRRRSFS